MAIVSIVSTAEKAKRLIAAEILDHRYRNHIAMVESSNAVAEESTIPDTTTTRVGHS